MTATATLGGIPLLALETVGWRFTQGVNPYQRVFEMKRSNAEALLKASPAGSETELVISSPGRKTLTVKALSVLSLSSASHPDRASVLVSDRRYFWDRKVILRRYNVRRRSGEYRLVDGALQRMSSLPDVTYAKYSLKNEQRAWTAYEVVIDVLKEVLDGKPFNASKVEVVNQLDIDGLELQDDGQSALKRVLAYIPGLSVYVDANGTTVLTLTTGGEEGPELGASGSPIVGPSLYVDVDMNRTRPKAIEVYFQPEDEVRFDFLEGYTSTGPQAREARTMTNVMPLPDLKLKIGKTTVVQNTLVEINQALLDAWNNDTANPMVVPWDGGNTRLEPLTPAVLQRLWLSPGGMSKFFMLTKLNPAWARRWNALLKHYRQTFQISRRWRDRLRSARAERVAIIDPENARHAPSDVYADWCVIPTSRMAVKFGGSAFAKMVLNNKAWDDLNDPNRLLVKGHIAPTAVLVPIDEDQMVFRVVFQKDQEGDFALTLPSIMDDVSDGGTHTIPTADPRSPRGNFMLHLGVLSPKHRFTTIITTATASPNGLASCFKIKVSPDDAKSVLPQAIKRRIGACNGPVLQLLVRPQVATARFAWKDEESISIENAILNGGPRSTDRLVDPEHVGNVAKAMAAIIYALFADRVQGTNVTAIDPDRLPVGRISAVVHELGRRGIALTRMEMPPHMTSIDFMSLLPEGTRRQLFGKVQP